MNYSFLDTIPELYNYLKQRVNSNIEKNLSHVVGTANVVEHNRSFNISDSYVCHYHEGIYIEISDRSKSVLHISKNIYNGAVVDLECDYVFFNYNNVLRVSENDVDITSNIFELSEEQLFFLMTKYNLECVTKVMELMRDRSYWKRLNVSNNLEQKPEFFVFASLKYIDKFPEIIESLKMANSTISTDDSFEFWS